MPDLDKIQRQLKKLSDDYAAQLPEKLLTIKECWSALSTHFNKEAINELIFLTHKLAGSGTSFGFQNVSDKARVIEIELNTVATKTDQTFWDNEQRIHIENLIHALTEETHTSTLDSNKKNIAKPIKNSDLNSEEQTLIYIQVKNRLLSDELVTKLKTYNYNARSFFSLNDLHQAISDNRPDVVIIDPTLFNTHTKKMFSETNEDHSIKIIHLADSNDFTDRLEAVRLGVDYYFTKPFEFSDVIDTLDTIAHENTVSTTKVLIVDDSISTSQFYALSLNSIGIETKIITDPFKVMDTVIDFKPDLILLDLHMPKCSGLELAAVIRQQENYISTPIIFLSGETDKEKQLEMLKSGADEFLTKPVNVNHLIAVVKNKVIRYRQLSAYMHNDSLTGLLNHTSILTSLDTEIARAARENTNLSYAMIDIDFFKKVNDTYGHHMGDVVIKNISRFLKQNLRITDIVGRYGGEEFVALLPGIDAETAQKVMQKILNNFSKIEFAHINHKFSVTFSCGVSDYATFSSARGIIDAADKALYAAKDAGRRCIKIAVPEIAR